MQQIFKFVGYAMDRVWRINRFEMKDYGGRICLGRFPTIVGCPTLIEIASEKLIQFGKFETVIAHVFFENYLTRTDFKKCQP
jgi:hypothetical protein